jgi:hypothetical protein
MTASDLTAMTLTVFKQCTQMMQSTAVQPQPAAVPPPPSKPVQTTDISKKLAGMTYAGICDDDWPSERLMLKLEALPPGKRTSFSVRALVCIAQR